jgi:hypothetical protein
MEGDTYKVRPFIALQHIILIIWFFIGLFMFVYGEFIKTGIGIVSFTLLILILMILRPSKFRVFLHDQQIQVDRAKLEKTPDSYAFSDFISFELDTIYWLRIPINSTLYARFNFEGKTNRHVISQSFGRGPMQVLSNELEKLITTDQV